MFEEIRKEWCYFCHDQQAIWSGCQKPTDYLLRLLPFLIVLPAHVLGFILAAYGYYKVVR